MAGGGGSCGWRRTEWGRGSMGKKDGRKWNGNGSAGPREWCQALREVRGMEGEGEGEEGRGRGRAALELEESQCARGRKARRRGEARQSKAKQERETACEREKDMQRRERCAERVQQHSRSPLDRTNPRSATNLPTCTSFTSSHLHLLSRGSLARVNASRTELARRDPGSEENRTEAMVWEWRTASAGSGKSALDEGDRSLRATQRGCTIERNGRR